MPRFTASSRHSSSSRGNSGPVKSATVSTQGTVSPWLMSPRRVTAASSGLAGLDLP